MIATPTRSWFKVLIYCYQDKGLLQGGWGIADWFIATRMMMMMMMMMMMYCYKDEGLLQGWCIDTRMRYCLYLCTRGTHPIWAPYLPVHTDPPNPRLLPPQTIDEIHWKMTMICHPLHPVYGTLRLDWQSDRNKTPADLDRPPWYSTKGGNDTEPYGQHVDVNCRGRGRQCDIRYVVGDEWWFCWCRWIRSNPPRQGPPCLWGVRDGQGRVGLGYIRLDQFRLG